MTQQVNLYQPILRQQKRIFSSETIALIVAGVTVVMLLLWAYNAWQLEMQRSRLAEVQARETQTAEDVARLTRELKQQSVSTTLREKVESLRAEHALKDRLYRTVFLEGDDGKGRFANGFAGALESLGRSRVNGLWLTRIVFADSGRQVDFHGRTARAEQVPLFVNTLGEQPLLENLTFRRVRVLQEESRLSFDLSTSAPEKEEKAR